MPSERSCPRWPSDARCSITSRNSPLASASGPSADSRRSSHIFLKNFSHPCHTSHTQAMCAALCTNHPNSGVAIAPRCTSVVHPQQLNAGHTVVNVLIHNPGSCASSTKTRLSPESTPLNTVTELYLLFLL